MRRCLSGGNDLNHIAYYSVPSDVAGRPAKRLGFVRWSRRKSLRLMWPAVHQARGSVMVQA